MSIDVECCVNNSKKVCNLEFCRDKINNIKLNRTVMQFKLNTTRFWKYEFN